MTKKNFWLTIDKNATYRIRNWSEYNKALVKRGSLNIWFDEAATTWREVNRVMKRGRPRMYSYEAILCALVVRAVFHLPLRALRGFLLSIFFMFIRSLLLDIYTERLLQSVIFQMTFCKIDLLSQSLIFFYLSSYLFPGMEKCRMSLAAKSRAES